MGLALAMIIILFRSKTQPFRSVSEQKFKKVPLPEEISGYAEVNVSESELK